MARQENVEVNARRANVRRANATRKYGEELGGAFMAYFENGTPDDRALFANAVTAGLRSEDPIDQAKAIEALLQVFEGKIAVLTQQAQTAVF